MSWSRKFLTFASAGVVLAAALPAAAAVDAYLQIDGIKGDSVAKPGWIEVNSFQWGASRGISSPTGGAADREASMPSVSEITIVKEIDRASPMFAKCAAGCHYGKVMLAIRKAGGEPVTYVLTDATVSNYHTGTGGDRPVESLTFHFTKIDAQGQSGATGVAGMAAMPPAGAGGPPPQGLPPPGLPPPGR